MPLTIEPHPLLDAVAFESCFAAPLAELGAVASLVEGLRADYAAPLASSDEVRGEVRALLRHGGYKPTGRGKPASEYLLKAAAEGTLSSINAAVDACNVVSLHSGLPISVVDRELARQPLRIGVAPEGASYVFNASGQSIELAGLLCLFDAEGPIANAVKDSQRTKTHAGTTKTLSVIWGTRALPGRSELAFDWYRALLESLGASVLRVELAR
jgi:DNA/RNA-binding domain of Phe-tRNA-synthetase-like protein